MKTTLYVQNLKCDYCETTIIKVLSKLKHVRKIFIKRQFATITFEHTTPTDIEVVKKTLSKLGYPPFGEKNNILNKAKSILTCAVSDNKHQNK